ncbi:phosphoadenosine phosphosulfate reductase family protein [Rhizobiaceae bacterium n13]|uniref:phosphoadenosine phosphosulfate reductase family protein n=1 Tax=Ferirhizobium litorale TaxID=2927786 RepID=UPI0024B2C9B7|nr:phosphoadenosine phosphosulfate reductase family protein [Fererhizobium litorale]MDI7864322.1 phosphoadenosine phosphosulfate reductase family protein [Fererhizobium litorale]
MNEIGAATSERDILATIERARALLDDGDYQAARLLATGAYEQAKAAGGYAEKVKASRQLIDKARRMQADALKIETYATIRLADEVDAAQASGQISRGGRRETVHPVDRFTLDEVGVDKRRLHDARKIRNAERAEPGFVERVIEARLSEGLEPHRKSISHAIGTRSASKEEKGDQLYETPAEATRTLLALESFSANVKEPAVGKGAIMRVLEDAGYDVLISDLRDRGVATRHGELQQVGDFLTSEPGDSLGVDLVTNPPYGDLTNRFLAHALRVHRPRKMAALLNFNFATGFEDPDRVFLMEACPPSRIYVFSRRLPMMHRDGWTGPTASSQMNTAWYVWERNDDGSYGDGYPRLIRVDWKKFEDAQPLAPGAGGHVGPMQFAATAPDEFKRETPRKSLDERIDEERDRAVAWISTRTDFDVVELRRGIGCRNSVAEALIAAFIDEGLIGQADENGSRWLPVKAIGKSESAASVLATVFMPPIATDAIVDAELREHAPVAIGVSGGKDSQAAAIATVRHLDAIGHQGPRLLVHADLGVVEWNDSLPVCEALAQRLGLELLVVRRAAGDLMERWEARWRSSIERYENLSTVTLVPCWSTPKMRFCTSEMKTHVICSALKKRFGSTVVINVTGVRRAESSVRSRCTIAERSKDAPLLTWRPIADWSTEEVFSAIDDADMSPHPAYSEFGMSRVSCRFCIMSNLDDLAAAAAQEESHELLRRMVALECDSGFAFQGSRWLGDVAPQALGADLVRRLAEAKERAAARLEIEAQVTEAMLYVKGWPARMLTDDEADLLAAVRGGVTALYGFQSRFLTRDEIHGRYSELIEARERKGVRT